MSSNPPDPGHALQLAKDCAYHSGLSAFDREGALRWLYPEGGRVWVAATTSERTISQTTYDRLRAGTQTDRQKALNIFQVGSVMYALIDDGFEALTEPV